MKTSVRQLRMLLPVSLVLATAVPRGFAAVEEIRPHFVWMWEACIEPSQMNTYMKCRAESAMLDAKHKFEFPYLTFADGFTVYTCGIFETFASLDNWPEKMAEYAKKTGPRGEELGKQSEACVSRCTATIAVYRPDLSYQPETPVFAPDFSKPFFNISLLYRVKPGKLDQAVEVAKKLKKMHEEKKTSMAYLVYERICGPDVPTLVAVMSAENEAQFLEIQKKTMETLGEEYERVLTDNLGVIDRIETLERMYVPQASHVPEGSPLGE